MSAPHVHVLVDVADAPAATCCECLQVASYGAQCTVCKQFRCAICVDAARPRADLEQAARHWGDVFDRIGRRAS